MPTKTYPNPAAITVGVVGYGGAFNMGRQHLNEMKAAGMTPVAVVELDPKRLEVARADFPGIETYGTVDEMLAKSKVELVTVITPHNTHAELGLKIAAAGRHVVLEKPIAITTKDCDAMIVAGKDTGVVVSTYHNRHWDGWILRANELFKAGAFGDIVRIDLRMGAHGRPGDWWRSSRSISGGILYDWGVHLLEYSLQLITAPVTEVSGYAWNGYWAAQPDFPWAKDANEDEAQATVRFASGQRINLSITHLDAAPEKGFMKIVGTKATHVIGWDGTETTTPKGGGVVVTERASNPKGEGEKFYQNIAAHLTTGEALVITGEWARRPIHLLDLAAQSAKAGRALPVKYA
ncbi:MAG: gfo/Idh/MocA family oxidoreductase [Verrucomicrobia bacterium]|nr:MAG: gfo/Idh/MocA family oxidoreductase [Verrucomicrobiota bacterium]